MQNQNAQPKAELCAALIEAQKNIKSVHKGSENSFHRYKYASAEDMIAASRDALLSAGLTVVTLSQDVESTDSMGDMLKVVYQLLHSTGACHEIRSSTPVHADKGKPWDKAMATAKTTDLAYFFRNLLMIPRVEEEMDHRDDRKYTPPAKKPPKPTVDYKAKVDAARAAVGPDIFVEIAGAKDASAADWYPPADKASAFLEKCRDFVRSQAKAG